MRVEEDEGAVAGAVIRQLDPCHHARQGCIPTFAADRVGRFAEPEGSAAPGFEAIAAIEDERDLAAGLAILTRDAEEHVVLAEAIFEFPRLRGQDFLQADEIAVSR